MPPPIISGRRMPPPPPPDDLPDPPANAPPPLPARSAHPSEQQAAPPPLPSRPGRAPPPGNVPELPRLRKTSVPEVEYLSSSVTDQQEEAEGPYEEPANTMHPEPPKLPHSSFLKGTGTSRFARDESFDSDDDGWSDGEFEPVEPRTPQKSDDDYLVPEGGDVREDDDPIAYNIPDESQHSPTSIVHNSKQIKPPIPGRQGPHVKNEDIQNGRVKLNTANSSSKPPPLLPQQNGGLSIADRKKEFEKKAEEPIGRPVLPVKPVKPTPFNKPPAKPGPPQPPAKPELEGPELPPRPSHERALPSIPQLPPETQNVRQQDIPSERNASNGSDFSGSADSLPSSVKPSAKSFHPFLPNQVKPGKSVPDLPARPDPQPKLSDVLVTQPSTEVLYCDGFSEDLSRFDWFHGEVERVKAQESVLSLKENGSFLVRASKQDGVQSSHPYTLVVTLDNKAFNLKIRLRNDNRFAIGFEKSDEVSFTDVPEMVEHHRKNNIKLAGDKVVQLRQSPRKK